MQKTFGYRFGQSSQGVKYLILSLLVCTQAFPLDQCICKIQNRLDFNLEHRKAVKTFRNQVASSLVENLSQGFTFAELDYAMTENEIDFY